jgi:hypothetical protein
MLSGPASDRALTDRHLLHRSSFDSG